MLEYILIVVGLAYLMGYVVTAGLYLSWVGHIGPVGCVAALFFALAWPVWIVERWANPKRPPLP